MEDKSNDKQSLSNWEKSLHQREITLKHWEVQLAAREEKVRESERHHSNHLSSSHSSSTKSKESVRSPVKRSSSSRVISKHEHQQHHHYSSDLSCDTFPPVIKLNVGGRVFHTTISTLTRKPESMIAAMFSGRHPLLRDDQGCYFIDRNPEEFDIILRFLRTGQMLWPKSTEDKERLQLELDYFGIDEPDLSWMLRTDAFKGWKQYPYHEDIYLAVSKGTDWDLVQNKSFDCPKGFHWASTQEFKDLISESTDDTKGYPYYDTGGWKGYVWEGKERIMFCFNDSKLTQAYKHSGHASSYYLHTGLTESFAGIVCVRDKNMK